MNIVIAGQNISRMRKERNMTQMELAEKLYVSYQAVSSWERGLTMPDIDKLSELSHIFNCSIEEILGSRNTAVEKILNGEIPNVEEIPEIAPIVPPAVIDETVKAAGESKGLTPEILISIAPFIGRDLLDELTEKTRDCIDDLTVLCDLAPFLSREALNKLVERIEKVDDPALLCSLAPFIGEKGMRTILKKIRQE